MRAISAFSRDAGMSTRVCLAVTALRIRASMSAIGSVISFCSLGYQLLFVTPVMSPSSASLRKHRRHSANLRMYARGRPHRRQRFRRRILYFGGFCSFAIFAVVAISVLPEGHADELQKLAGF